MFRTSCVLFVTLLTGTGSANLLLNGDFEQALDVGWTDTVVGSAGLATFDRSDTLGQPLPGFAAKVYKYLGSYASLFQTVDVPNVNLTLSFDARFRIGGGSSTCWPVASLWVRYADASGRELGNTRFYLHDEYATWTKSDSVSLIEITDTTGAWHNYTLDISQELAERLPLVFPEDVAKITIDLFAYDNGT